MKMIWNGFTEWLRQAWLEHPLYTVMFGTIAFFAGAFLL